MPNMKAGVYPLEDVMMDDETKRANCGGTIPMEEVNETGEMETHEEMM